MTNNPPRISTGETKQHKEQGKASISVIFVTRLKWSYSAQEKKCGHFYLSVQLECSGRPDPAALVALANREDAPSIKYNE